MSRSEVGFWQGWFRSAAYDTHVLFLESLEDRTERLLESTQIHY